MEQLASEDYIHGGLQKDFYPESEREACNCPFCGVNSFEKIASERGLQVVECNACDLIYTNPRARSSQQNYFGDAEIFFNEARLIFSGKKTHHRDKNYEFELRKIEQYKKPGKLLDIGTYMGFFLRKAREFGWDVQGVEPSPTVSKIATEQFHLKIQNAFLEDAVLSDKSFDVITLIDVFEHMTNPKDILARCKDILKDDGILVIKVPNGNYNRLKQKLSSILGNHESDLWNCREHVVHYTYATFEKMVSSSGYSIKAYFIPPPIHYPVWQYYVGHYYQYPSPFILDWKRIILRNSFYTLGKVEKLLNLKLEFAPDLMFIVEKKK
jgi:2-polyprenyl-3-methyl-5-hydroxy-6-metoxy-1,4-benzoquinol methylase